jgi:serine/threonine protein kinase
VDTIDDVLLSVAKSIADGAHVDWPGVRTGQSGAHAADVLDEMAIVERIASLHASTDPTGMPGARTSEPLSDPVAWGHFKILERIGSGAFSAVYRAEDTKLRSEVALKLLRPRAVDAEVDGRMLVEAQLLARVRHQNVVTVHGVAVGDGRVGIWMEFVNGRTLADLLRAHGRFSAREAANVAVDLCRALAAVHRADLIHSDIKAHNVMRAEGGRIVLMDFGTGKDVAAGSSDAGRHASSDFAGTPLYLAPELFEGAPRSKTTDIYSLGVLLYHLVTGSYPVAGRTLAEIEDAHRRGSGDYLRDVRPDLPIEFIAVVERALDPDPRKRFQTAGAFEAALAPIVGQVVDDRSPRRWRKKGLTMMAIAAAMVVIIAIAISRFVGLSGGGSSPQPVAVVQSAPPASSSPAASNAQPEYQIETAVYRLRGSSEERLRAGERVVPGDMVFARVRASIATYVYIVNEDDQGEAFLLFPLPGQSVTNPLPAGTTTRIPGSSGSALLNWQITSAGGREHFLIFASDERLPAFEQMFAALPQPAAGKPVLNAPLSDEALGRLRSIGGLASSTPAPTASRLAQKFTTPLGDAAETTRGLWVRQFTVLNPR